MRRRTGLLIGGAAALAWAEWLHWRWSRSLVESERGAVEAVVVLGYRNPQATANFVNRWRVRAGIRSIAWPAESAGGAVEERVGNHGCGLRPGPARLGGGGLNAWVSRAGSDPSEKNQLDEFEKREIRRC